MKRNDMIQDRPQMTRISRMMRYALMVLTMVMAGVTEAWGQATDYSGYYYIASNDGYGSDPFYLCVADAGLVYDTDQPYLTTYKTGQVSGSIWHIQKAPGEGDYYYVIHHADSKYLTHNTTKTDTESRLRVHLQESLDEDNSLFFIKKESNYQYFTISPKAVSGESLNPAGNNYNNYAGTNNKTAKINGKSVNVGGLIGLWANNDVRSRWRLEEITIAPPTFSVNTSGDVTITPAAGTTVYYTLDGTNPTSSTPTSSTSAITILYADAIAASAIKAIAIRTSDNVPSKVATLPIVDYTYKIVNQQSKVALKKTVKQPVGTQLSGYTSIPADIRSSYISDETINFYSFDGTYNVGDNIPESVFDVADPVNATPATGTNIYVRYATTNLGNKYLHLQGARPLNLKNASGKYYKENSDGTVTIVNLGEGEKTTDKAFLWYISSSTSTGDPYDVLVKNSEKTKYLEPTPSLTTAAYTYYITDNTPSPDADSDGKADYEDITLKSYADDATLIVRVNEVEIPTSYHLIDKSDKDFSGPIESTSSSLDLPDSWKSPLVTKYHFWKASEFDITTNSGTTYYKLKTKVTNPETGEETPYTPTEIQSLTEVGNNEQIYVTYDVAFTFDTNAEDVIDESNTKYMLRFREGDSFYQEKSDAQMSTQSKAVYPYSNGDVGFNVYRAELWREQSTSGMSERPRWLWYIVSPTSDPYHVKIKSHKNEKLVANSSNTYQNYFYTHAVSYDEYAIENGNVTKSSKKAIVTGLTTVLAEGTAPTEYMVLKGSHGECILKTVDLIPLDLDGDGLYTEEGESNERRIVTSFEQYWKNYETVSKTGTYNYVPKATAPYLDNPAFRYTDNAQTNREPYKLNYYEAYAYGRPITPGDEGKKNDKVYEKIGHWFQTINMGEGEFTLEPTDISPQVILLDQHGWELMRQPLYKTVNGQTVLNEDALKKYDSPMVEEYQWYPSANKVSGYHKYTIPDPAPQIKIYQYNATTKKWEWKDNNPSYTTYPFTSTTLGADPYVDHLEQPSSVRTDFYVTYTVKAEYANAYAGAATFGETLPSKYVVKQGNAYAKNEGNTLATEGSVNVENVQEKLQWYLRPNFDIDKEMGYKYLGETGAQADALNKDGTEEEYVAAGKNGFDPYNLQIQSVANTERYFKTNSTGMKLANGAWEGTTTSLSLQSPNYNTVEAEGNNQTTVNITNTTFMAVGSDAQHISLMPRFDNTKVVNALTGTQITTPAAATQYFSVEMVPTVVNSSDKIKAMGGYFILAEDFTFAGVSIGTVDAPFKGRIDGKLHTISSTFSSPFIAYAEDAVIKNVIIDNVSISSGTNVGAICNVAKGQTRIYNCGVNGGSVGGSNYVGGIVGLLDFVPDVQGGVKNTNKGSRVINCYSYATITGGAHVGGIVGYNNYASKATDIRTMVMNCMFYGDITGGSTVSPVYGGNNIDNLSGDKNPGGVNTFNYYAYDKLKTKKISDKKYNCALAVEEKYLTRFEFYRLLLNSNKKLAAFYATGSAGNAGQMAKWVLETADKSNPDPKPYPVLKPQGYYPSIINYDTKDLGDYSEDNRNQGLKTGELTVNITGTGVTTSQLTLVRTDKDFDRFNFNYDKVQLPYYNDVGTGNYADGKVVTGWKIISMTVDNSVVDHATEGTFTASDSWGGYNFADRKTYAKDLYSKSGRVFSQGAYFNVPYGVTEITIEPYWGNAAFVADANYDVVYTTGYSRQSVTQVGSNSTTFKGKTVYTSISSALGTLSGSTVYDNAIVLVGNLHQGDVPSNGNKAFTIMSVDEDNDHEPDYSMIYHHTSRQKVSPIRFDFLNIPGTAQAQKPNGATNLRNFTIFKTMGWFEITNTSLAYSNQMEYENRDGNDKQSAPLILLGGYFEQFVSTQKTALNGSTIYIHVGDNVLIDQFGLGTHSDGSNATPHVPVSVTGGEFKGFYLTGTYNQDAAVKTDNAECYISGGHFLEAAGACQEQINGNVRWQIYDADIDDFYGGGINAAKPIKGNVQTDIYNSHVGTFCGGPKFGDMQSGKTVITNAEGCTFNKFFGGGFGGTSYSRKKYYDHTSYNFNTLQNNYINDRGKYFDGVSAENDLRSVDNKLSYGKKGIGVAADFDYEFFVWSSGTTGARFFVKFASFSLAACNNVSSSLKGCTINTNFYGGGSYGEVKGKATSVLDGCTVHGNVFGGGYSAQLPTIQVRDAGFTTIPKFNSSSGMFEPGVFSGTTEFTWKMASEDNVTLTNNQSGSDLTNHYIYTDVDLTALGKVGETDLTVKGNTVVEGGVFGGGDESAISYNATTGATGNTKVTIEKNDNNETPTINNVYGGGNTADVDGDAQVDVTGGTVSNDVFGGGKGASTVVSGDVTVNIGAKDATEGTLSGTGTIGNVYGGSAFGAVNAKKEAGSTVYSGTDEAPKTATVNIYGCTSIGNVFGGGLGEKTETTDIAAKNFGDVKVNVEGGTVSTAVYGGSNINGVLKSDAEVTLLGGTTGDSGDTSKDVVFGGGKGEPTLVNGDVLVNVGSSTYTGNTTIYGNIYGGSALGNTNATSNANFNTDKTTKVNLYAGTVNGNVFGGGLGRKYAAAVAQQGTEGEPGYVPAQEEQTAVESFVGGDVNVLLDGAKVHQIFGCNNLNGTPKGHVKVHVKQTNNFSGDNAYKEEPTTPLDDRTTYDVTAVYGGGNQADYNPTKATGSDDDKQEAFAEVLIEGCDKTSIEYVYGGGNAAAVPATEITVNSAYIIGYLFGGGNGAGDGNPGADVGIIDKVAYATDNSTGIYGTGIAKTKLIGGQVRYVYGGSNTKGNVRGGTTLERNETNTCELKVKEIYGAGQVAPMDGDVNIVLECMPKEFVEAVYGGAKNATINGNVSLTVTSGKFGRVFGGNNEGGSINGSITVNAYEDGCEPLIIGELYGGGYNAPYSIWGCNDNDNDGTWTPNTPAGNPHVAAGNNAIEVNVYSCTSIGKVFGGGYGEPAKVIGNTHVYINTMQGIVNKVPRTYETEPENVYIGKIGQVFGGGYGASVEGDVTIDIGTATVYNYNKETEAEKIGIRIINGTDYLNATSNTPTSITAGVYGGGYAADVDGNVTLNIGKVSQNQGINIRGDIFGGGYGETTHVTGNVRVNIGADTGTGSAHNYVGYANITGDVYGGSAKGKVNSYNNNNVETASEGKTTQVNLYGGNISGNLYGGGLGESTHEADVYGPVTVNVYGGHVNNVFGCNNVLGSPKSTATVNINSTPTPVEPDTYIIENVYGGGNQAAYNGTGGVSVVMSGGYVNNVFGGGLGATAIVNGTTNVTLTDGTATNDIYGGGSLANVAGAVNVTLNGGTVTRDVYGGGALAQTNTEYLAGDATKEGYITQVTLSGATVTGNLYGGGLGQLEAGTEGNSGYVPAVAADVNGPVTVSVTDGTATNVFGCNNINGSPKQTATVTITGTSAVEGSSGISSVYGGGNQAAYTGSGGVSVSISGGTANYVYGGGLGSTAVVNGSTNVTISGTSVIANDIYGGGSQADVTGSVSVIVSGGMVVNNVYGGGALASTNTANWNPNKVVTPTYDEVSFLVVGESIVTGLYTRSGAGTNEDPYVYTEVTVANTKAADGVKYYRQINGGWANDGTTSTANTTTVTLTGGVMGNAYGGGLGNVDTPVYVYGDVVVNVNKSEDITAHGGTGAGFTRHLTTENVVVGGKKYNSIPITGSVFGCNDVNGTPRGDVTLTVYSTRQLNSSDNVISGHSPNSDNKYYEVQAVYGGGNQADYQPAPGKRTHVIIKGCDETSIEKVYGGGNSATVPKTDVTIWGSFDISDAFGGGNGSLPIKRNGVWIENAGSKILHDTNIVAKGGKIGNVFGGNDGRGSVGGTMHSDYKNPSGDCPLKITKIYGANNEADSDGDVNVIISGCTAENADIEYVCGGSYNANIHGDLTLTITSGIFKNVYGGNDARGSIGGNITVNIQEEDDCKPIIIQNLVGGGFAADYPGEDSKTGGNARRVQRNNDGTYKIDPSDATKYLYEDFTTGKITINVKSATRIDNIYGGGFQAHVTGDTEVNVNMIKGHWAGVKAPSAYTGLPNVHQANYYKVLGLTVGTSDVRGLYVKNGENYTLTSDETAASGKTYYRNEANAYVIDDAIGTVGNVFGGGNEGNVYGNTVVNIGNATNIDVLQRKADGTFDTTKDINDVLVINYGSETVLGANITGVVYGGGNLGDVGKYHVVGSDYVVDETGFTSVNIGAKESATSGTYEAVAEGTEKVKIAGNVFGGGKGVVDNTFKLEKGMVLGKAATKEGTHVRIGNGTVEGNVYGGGEVGRVEWNTDVTIGYGDGVASGSTPTSAPVIGHHVFGAGQGVNTHGYSALVRGNSTVTVQGNAKVGNSTTGGGSVYGGGEYASVGKYSVGDDGMPHSLANNGSGYCTVTVKGYAEIGPDNMKMHNPITDKPDFTGHVFGAGKGALPYEGFSSLTPDWHITETPWRVTVGNVKQYYNQQTFGDDYIDDYMQYIETLGLATQTYVTIGGHAFVKGSVYGGSENGHVQHDTQVTIQDYCQIGAGYDTDHSLPKYEEAAFIDPIGKTESDINAAALAECNHWEYDKNDGSPYDPYAKYLNSTDGKYYYDSGHTKTVWGGAPIAKDGHTFYGNVFGGGSGKDPYAPGEWHREAGSVGGNTTVTITGGHILTSVYGGNEITDVKGSCTITMSGGTLGVPRTLAQIAAHPVTCYLFGAGKGDQRVHFNTWTNVASTSVTVSGGIIYGSTFGGGEDGHILGNAVTNISGSAKIGTWGTSYVDGNVFGGGRGFSGEAQTAGTVGGNVTVNISNGTMLGSIYGGGRLASVGSYFTDPDDPIYGQLQEGESHGHITVNITGGTIGNISATGDGTKYSGNVFGGCMGRLTLLNGTINPLWPELAEAKRSTITISGGTIIRNVYGGGEYGTVREDASITMSGGTVNGSVFGGGYGSSDFNDPTTIEVHWGGGNQLYNYTPMQWAGTVGGNTSVNISGGTVNKNVYGGGELASVGIINYIIEQDENGSITYKGEKYKHPYIKKHYNEGDTFYDFGLSWPYEFTYIPNKPNTAAVGGKATVTITGSSFIGTSNDNESGYVFGAGKGKASFGVKGGTNDDIEVQRYTEAFCANVRETEVTIGGGDDNPQLRTVYGGGDDGHVYMDTKVTIHSGTIERSVFGGGKGTDTFWTTLLDSDGSPKTSPEKAHSWTAGKVYGNTSVTMHDGSVGMFIYGGGNMASVGKGNYAGGSDDYSTAGYGELPSADGAIWTATSGFNPNAAITESNKPTTMADHFLSSGKTNVTILGGRVGPDIKNLPEGAALADADGIPYGSVFGGSRGTGAAESDNSPRYKYVPDYFLGYVNKTAINIGGYINNDETTTLTTGAGPTIYGSVYGGGQDGHVRNSTEVRIFKGKVDGQGTYDTAGRSGNVFGAGSGIGTYTVGGNKYCNKFSGSVACSTLVDVKGGSIAGSVYGGGALASVGPPMTTQDKNEQKEASSDHASYSNNKVTIEDGNITGSVYGASRGPGSTMFTGEPPTFTGVGTGDRPYDPSKYATSIWTEVDVKGGTIGGSVYGGGEMGQVKESTEVYLTGGSIAGNAFGGGKGTRTSGATMDGIAADVGGSTTVELNKNVATTAKGCSLERIFGCNDLNGTPRGHVKVHVHATQNKAKANISEKIAPPTYSSKRGSNEGYKAWLARLISVAKSGPEGAVLTGLDPTVINSAETTLNGITTEEASLSDDQKKTITETALTVIKEIDKLHDYDVKAVYGGGNLAQYDPYGPAKDNTAADFKATVEGTEVIIEGCDVTSIKQVYGGGNAASVPASSVSVKSVFVIDELFGGGNGLDHYTINNLWYENPGANVGYYIMEEHVTDGSKGDGSTEATKYQTIAKANSSTKEERIEHYTYGSGRAETTVTGGHIHTVYGGSNEKGNIREVALSTYQKSGTCSLVTDETYGGSKTAEMDGEIQVVMDCVEDGGIYFGGSQNADVNNNVTINITNGTYTKVYGGNNKAGTINGVITINIEEKGCSPIVIGELYGGGYYAPYSVYGYKKGADGKYVIKVEPDPTTPNETINSRIPLKAGEEGALATPHRDPHINIISATSIGTIYGGGDRALVVGSPHINVNMQKGIILEEYAKALEGYSSLTVANGGKDEDGNKMLPIGTIGTIFGGGHLATVEGNTYVDIGTGSWYNYKTKTIETITRNEATITGNVFGGGEGEASVTGDDAFTCAKAMVGHDGGGITESEGNTSVIIGNGSVGGSVYGGGKIGRVENNTSVTIGKEGDTTNEPIISGSVFGAGQGVDTHGYSGLVRGNSTVTIQGKAKIGHSVYGGGEKATVGRYWINDRTTEDGKPTPPDGTPLGRPYATRSGGACTVVVKDDAEIGPDDMTMTKSGGPDDTGYIFGAGKGVTPGNYTYSGTSFPYQMTLKNGSSSWEAMNDDETYLGFIETLGLASETDVTVSGNAFIKGSVYGGAENGFVQANTHVTIEGDCQIGNGYVQMDDNGNYLAEPYSLNRRYTATEWADKRLYKDGETNYTSSLPECASWPYESPYAPYDKYAQADGTYPEGSALESSEGGRPTGSDGHTFYGNVFGGGSGYFPYAAGKWHMKAGSVGGNITVDITGGHILSNLYGGNEMTNVTGDVTINFSGTATLGVPRTLGQIMKHPVACNFYGGGKGDQRVLFNKDTNVKNVDVNVTGGTIYGSVFGGGEDGHVMANTTVTIGKDDQTGPTIGTWGTSGLDGNVFGGGRGFAGDAYTAGNVAGAVTMTIKGGTMLGSVYGGGRLASVGYGLYDATTNGSPTEGYGEMRDDNKMDDDSTPPTGWFPKGRGHIDITINGGTIGNDHEYVFVPTGTTEAGLGTLKTNHYMPNTEFVFDKDLNFYRLSHTKGGNVFAGGMGRMYKMDGSTPVSDVDWWKLGNVKSTKLTINGGNIKGNVYGGGELGMVQGTHTSADSKSVSTEIIISGGTIGTEIQGDVTVPGASEGDPSTTEKQTLYTFGSVFGGGYGSVVEKLSHTPSSGSSYETYPKYIAGRVKGSTEVTMSDGAVKASVYGGGEMAAVGESNVLASTDPVVLGETLTGAEGKALDGNTWVTISGGTIGIPKVGDRQFGGATMGNVYGGGSGYINTVRSGQIYGSTHVTIGQADDAKPTVIYHNIYGGGAYGTVGEFTYGYTTDDPDYKGISKVNEIKEWKSGGNAEVTITAGTIGTDGKENGMVFGSSRGDVNEPGKRDDYVAWVNNTLVKIGTKNAATGPDIRGSVYGSGENGHTFHNTVVDVHSGTIGIKEGAPITTSSGKVYYGAEYPYRGNVYGGGCGTDTYTKNGKAYYNPWSGIVRGNTTVNIDGGVIVQNVYGAGSMGSVGWVTNVSDTTTVNNEPGVAKHADVATSFALSWPYKFEFAENTGTATINITGGHLGIAGKDGGDVFGSARGEAGDRYATAHFAYVKDAKVTVNYPTTIPLSEINDLTKGCITGSVHGSGEDGYVYGDAYVTLNKGLIYHSLYGAGKGKGTYKQKLLKIGATPKPKVNEGDPDTYEDSEYYDADIYSLISGRVMGNTYVTMNDGFVGRNVYGGGNMGSVGKGNYASGPDDYFPNGYGEKIASNLWTPSETFNPNAAISSSNSPTTNADYFLSSGKATVKVFGGTVGYIDETDPKNSIKNSLPYGNVFGGSAGEAAANVKSTLSPRWLYCPAFFVGYVNDADVNIGGYECTTAFTYNEKEYAVGDKMTLGELQTALSGSSYMVDGMPNTANWKVIGPTKIYSSVYGGGQDGHVRRDAHVTMVSGEIGQAFDADNQAILGSDLDDAQWLHRGNVYGAGSGISKYKFNLNGSTDFEDTTIDGYTYKKEDYSTSAGSVTRFTQVDILGGTIHRNVYGGGSLASIGPLKTSQTYDPYKKDLTNTATLGKQSQCTVTIGGAGGTVTIGTPTDYNAHYGGEVYGACRGLSSDNTQIATSVWTKVLIKNGATIMGNVYGGGDNGMVKKDTDVQIGE